MKIKRFVEVEDLLSWESISHINIGSSYTQSVLNMSVGGRTWYGIELSDDMLKLAFPPDIVESLKLYDQIASGLMWSQLVYHADDNPDMAESDMPGHFYRCTDYIERVLMDRIQKLNPDKVVTNRRDLF